MNTKVFLTAAIIAALGLTACSNDDVDNNPREEVKIVTSVNGVTNTPLLRASIDPATGAGNLENGDKILLIVFNSSDGFAIGLRDYTIGSSKLYWDNLITGDYSGTQWSADQLASLGELPYDFIAYYPNIPFLDVAFYGFNAATATDPDLLGAKTTGVAKGGTVDLAFNHLMHKLVVNLSSNVYTESELGSATVSLKNLFSTANIDHTSVLVIPSAASGTDAYPQKQGAKASFIVAPQTLSAAGTDMIEIAISGKTFTYKIPSGLTILESGKVLTLNLAINRDAVGLAGQNVTNWGTQDTVDENINFN